MSRVRQLLYITLVGCMAIIGQDMPKPPKAAIQFFVVDGLYKVVPFHVVSFKKVGNESGDLADKFDAGRIDGINVGVYQYVLSPDDAERYEVLRGRVALAGIGKRWLTLIAERKNLAQVVEWAPPGTNRGQIRGQDRTEGRAWVQLISIFDVKPVEEVPVEIDGSFQFQFPHSGKFILVVYQGADVAHLGTVEIRGLLPPQFQVDVSK